MLMRRIFVCVSLVATGLGSTSVSAHSAPATPIVLTCPTPAITQPGNYIATMSPPENCSAVTILEIAASNVTLNLNNRTIDGDDSFCERAILVSGTRTGVNISGGTVRDCKTGLRLDSGVTDSTISGMTALSNQFNGISADGARHTLTKNTAAGNGSNGIGVSGTDITISKNTLVHNFTGGIFSGDPSGTTITRNVVIGNSAGIDVRGPNTVITKNTVNWSDFSGIYVFGVDATDAFVSGNTSVGNGNNGIQVTGPSSTLTKNKSNGNRGRGIYVDAPDSDTENTVMSKNTTNDNIFEGIDANQAPNLVTGSGNKSKGNGGDGNCVPADLC